MERNETTIAASILTDNKITFTPHPHENRFTVGITPKAQFEFWPRTGRFKQVPSGGIEGRGIFTMIRYFRFLEDKK